MLSNHIDNVPGDLPPWLIELRLRKRNKQLQQQHSNQSSTAESPQTSSSPFFGSSTSSSVAFGGTTVQQPSSTTSRCHTVFSATTNGGNSDISVALTDEQERVKCVNGNNNSKMVQERPWIDHADQLIESIGKNDDSDSSEELKYGPGIVSKLKNRYLNLTLREATSKTRPSILNLRKATSLEHILDDYDIHEDKHDKHHDNKTERLFQRHNYSVNKSTSSNRYHARNSTNRSDMKRARSVEIISDLDHDSLLLTNLNDVKSKQRESLHEEMLVIEGSGDKTCNTTIVDKQKTLQIEDNMTFSNNIGLRLNRPMKIQPVMDEKEKPHIDIVKEKKKLFERPELRTRPPQSTGDVAAKVAGFKTIIDLTKASNKKPPIKQKPHIEKGTKIDRPKVQIKRENSVEKPHQIGSPIPPLRSPIKEYKPETKQDTTTTTASLPIQPDVSKVTPPSEEINGLVNSSLSETPDLIVHSSHHFRTEQIENFLKAEQEHGIVEEKNRINLERTEDLDFDRRTATENQTKSGSNSIIYTFQSPTKIKDHLPKIDSNKVKVEIERPTEIKIKSSPNKEKLSPNKEKLSPTKEKLSPNKEKLSPNKEQSSPNKEKLSPIKKDSSSSKQISNSNHQQLNSKSNSGIRQTLFPKEESTATKPSGGDIGMPISEQLKIEIIDNKILNKLKPSEPSILLKTHNQAPTSPTKVKVVTQVIQQKDLTKSVADSKNNSKLSNKVIEKNLINKRNGNMTPATDKCEQSAVKTTNEVPILIRKKLAPKKEQQNSLVFDFTGRKDVPDYVGNDGSIKPKEKIRPKPGEGGIIILPGATLDESLVDDDEDDWKKLLECPPSPCNITFTNDNILIEGRSSLKKLKKPKMTIRFIDTRPEIFEYPSETSLLEDNHITTTLSNSGSMGHTVPSLSGSSLANYTPKSAFHVEEFQLGLKPSQSASNVAESNKPTVDILEESVILQETPIQFSAGTNSDILF